MKSSLPAIDLSNAPHWMKYVAMLTGGLAALAGYLTVRGTYLANDAIFHNTQAVLCQAQASDAWADYQAQSVKARIIETSLATTTDPAARDKLSADDQKFRESQPVVQQQALDLEKQRDAELAHSKKRMDERDIAQYAGMATQLAIAISSVAALTRRFDVFIIGALVGLLGVGITAYAIFLHMTVPA